MEDKQINEKDYVILKLKKQVSDLTELIAKLEFQILALNEKEKETETEKDDA